MRAIGRHSGWRSILTTFCASALCLPAVASSPAAPDGTDRREQLSQSLESQSAAVEREAERRGIPREIQTINGERGWLTGFDGRRPIYTSPLSQSGALSINVSKVLDDYWPAFSGEPSILGIWDAGAVRPDHPELIGRVNNLEDPPLTVSDHATAVAGMAGSSGVDPAARGMLPNVQIDAYDIKDDLLEMADRALELPLGAGPANIAVSNHSYGDNVGWAQARVEITPGVFWQGWFWFGDWPEREDRRFGQYNERARDWDALCHAAPYFLPVRACGNDRTEGFLSNGTNFRYWDAVSETWVLKSFDSATDPYPDNFKSGGYDTIGTFAGSKNILSVGAHTVAISSNKREPRASLMAPFSSWGPTDDGRIKPDLVAAGDDVMTLWGTDPFFYAAGSGTSFSSPAAAAVCLFLQQMHTSGSGVPMLSSTLKALLIQTASEVDQPGPDYRSGWGLLDALAAADLLEEHLQQPEAGILTTGVLNEDATFEYHFTSDGVSPIRATLCWTDPPGPILTGMNDPTSVLVNDLDLRIAGPDSSTVHFPFRLDINNPLDPATQGDNSLDNVEQVFIPAPAAGEYVLTVTHKGALEGESQPFSLVLSGHPLPAINVRSSVDFSLLSVVGEDPPVFSWELLNPTDDPQPWSIDSKPDWLVFDSESGVIPAMGSVSVSAAFDHSVSTLGFAPHEASVIFKEDSTLIRRRERVAVDVWPASDPSIQDDFESGVLDDIWRVTGTGQYRGTVRSNLIPLGLYHFVMDDYMLGGARSRIELTTLLNVGGWSDMSVSFATKSFHNPSIGPPSNPYLGGSSTTGVAISEDGLVWHEVMPLTGANISLTYQPKFLDLSAALQSTGLQDSERIFLRFSTFVRQPADGATNRTGLAIDDVVITGVPKAGETWSIY
jgi:hypothetical protein